MHRAKILPLVLLSLLAISCTNSEWLLSVIYNRFDNRIYSDAADYADFNADQLGEIKTVVEQFHHWHRTTQLPKYAELLETVSERVRSDQGINENDIAIWAKQVEAFVAENAACHPMLSGIDIMIGLSDSQVEQIRENALQERREHFERFNKVDVDERFEKRYKRSLIWLKRFKFDISGQDKQFLREIMRQEPKLREASFELWANWDSRFYELLLSRHDAAFASRMKAHIAWLHDMTEQSYPQDVQLSRDLWQDFFFQLVRDESDSPTTDFPAWTDKMAKNLRAIALQVPKRQRDMDAADYCSV